MLKRLAFLLITLFACSLPAKAQFTERKERQKMWNKSKKRRKNREAFNPYLDKKEKESQKQGRENAKVMKKQGKAVKDQRKTNKRAQKKTRRWDHKKQR